MPSFLSKGLWLSIVVGFCPMALANSLPESQTQISATDLKSERHQPFFLRLDSSSYFRSSEPYFRDTASSQPTSFEMGVKAEGRRRIYRAGIDFTDTYRLEEEHHYLKPTELYAGLAGENVSIDVGRKLNTWSAGDDLWRLGVWQPRHVDDKLTRETAGLTGAFFEAKQNNHRALIFASGLNIPELGANFEVVEGRVNSKNPWFRPPTSSFKYQGKEADIQYIVNEPSVSEVINRPSFGAQYEMKISSRAYARASYVRKPMAQPLLGANIRLLTSDPPFAKVDVYPRIIEHELYGLDLGAERENGLKYWLSLAREIPIRDHTPDDWTTQEVNEATIISTYFGVKLDPYSSKKSEAYISYLRVAGGDAKDQGPLTFEKPLFERRYYFQNAIQLGLSQELNVFRYPTRVLTSGTYDFDQHGMVAHLSMDQKLSRSWSAHVALDVIGLVDMNGQIKEGFTSIYRANDRVQMGMAYVF